MSDIAVIALVVIAIILYSSWKRQNTSDALSVELSNLEKNLKILKQDVKFLEDINKNISTEFAEAKRYNNYIACKSSKINWIIVLID